MKNKYVVVLKDDLTGEERVVIRTKSQVQVMKNWLTFSVLAIYRVGERVKL